MPELPEVETMRRGILGAIGSQVTDVVKLRCPKLPIEITPPMSTFRRRVVGRKIVDITGKHMAAKRIMHHVFQQIGVFRPAKHLAYGRARIVTIDILQGLQPGSTHQNTPPFAK